MPYLLGTERLCEWDPATVPGPILNTKWTFPGSEGKLIQSYTISPAAGIVTYMGPGPHKGIQLEPVRIIWGAPGNYPFTSTATYADVHRQIKETTKGGVEQIYAPTVTVLGVETLPFTLREVPGLTFADLGVEDPVPRRCRPGFGLAIRVRMPDGALDYDGRLQWLQLANLTMSYQPYYGQAGRVIAETTGGLVLDGIVPYEGVSTRVGSIGTAFEITDSPQIPLPSNGFSLVTIDLQFRMYCLFKPNKTGFRNFWVSLGYMEWSTRADFRKASDSAPWRISNQHQAHSDWRTDYSLPTWNANAEPIRVRMRQRLDAEKASRSTPPLSALALSLFTLPEDKPKYQAYNGRFDTSSGQSSKVYPKHFLAYYGCLMSEVDSEGRFWCWMLPDTAKVAKGFPGMISFAAVSSESKYDAGKSARQLWERTLNWKMEVAPLCHAGKMALDVRSLWSRFTPVDVTSLGIALNSVLPDLKVTQCSWLDQLGTWNVSLSRPLKEPEVRAIAALNWITSLAPQPPDDEVYLRQGITASFELVADSGQMSGQWLENRPDGYAILGYDRRVAGIHFNVVAHGDDIYSFNCSGQFNQAAEAYYLDGHTQDGTLGFAPNHVPPFTGARWKAKARGGSVFTFVCQGHGSSTASRYLTGQSADQVARLSPDDKREHGAQWRLRYETAIS